MQTDQDATPRTRWRIVAGTALLGIMVGALVSMLATPQYTSTAKVLVEVNGRDHVADLLQPSASVVTSPRVMSAVIDELRLPLTPSQLADKVEVSNPANTTVLDVAATDTNPEVAQSIANAAAAELARIAGNLDATDGTGDPLVQVRVLMDAQLPTSPSAPETLVIVAIGFLAGLAAGVVAVLMRERVLRRRSDRFAAAVGGEPDPSP